MIAVSSNLVGNRENVLDHLWAQWLFAAGHGEWLFGASLAEIAAQLVLSEGTVRNHLSTAMQKLGAQNRMEAARLAEQKGWL